MGPYVRLIVECTWNKIFLVGGGQIVDLLVTMGIRVTCIDYHKDIGRSKCIHFMLKSVLYTALVWGQVYRLPTIWGLRSGLISDPSWLVGPKIIEGTKNRFQAVQSSDICS